MILHLFYSIISSFKTPREYYILKRKQNLHNLSSKDFIKSLFLDNDYKHLLNIEIIFQLVKEEILINEKKDIEILIKFNKSHRGVTFTFYSLENPKIFKHFTEKLFLSFFMLHFDLERNPYIAFNEIIKGIISENTSINFIEFKRYEENISLLTKINQIFNLEINIRNLLNDANLNSEINYATHGFKFKTNYLNINFCSIFTINKTKFWFEIEIDIQKKCFSIHVLDSKISFNKDFLKFKNSEIEGFIFTLLEANSLSFKSIEEFKTIVYLQHIKNY